MRESEMGDLTTNANHAKLAVLERLRADGILSDDQLAEYTNKWQIIIVPRKWHKRWANIFLKDGAPDDVYFKYVKFED